MTFVARWSFAALAVAAAAPLAHATETTPANPGSGVHAGASAARPPFSRPSDEELRRRLGPEAYSVTQRDGTEPPFHNAYWNEHRAGIYVDVVSGDPLFSSLDKFDSGTGWPSFTRPIDPSRLETRVDRTLGMARTEVRSALADSHLGHVFDDGPPPTGLRYCMNSAALRFVPVDRLVAEGYGAYLPLFEKDAGKSTARAERRP